MISLFGIGLIETLGAYLELQILHQLEDMIGALENKDLLIADSIVALLVVEIHQRGNLWELISNMLQEGEGLLLTPVSCLLTTSVIVELDDNHQFTACAIADNDIAKQTHLLSEIEEGDALCDGIVADLVANLVVQVVHQPALLNRQDLVEGSRDVETDGRHVLQALTLVVGQGGDLFLCQITFVGTAVIEFIAVFLCLYTSQNRPEFR